MSEQRVVLFVGLPRLGSPRGAGGIVVVEDALLFERHFRGWVAGRNCIIGFLRETIEISYAQMQRASVDV